MTSTRPPRPLHQLDRLCAQIKKIEKLEADGKADHKMKKKKEEVRECVVQCMR
jgi:hypothetical protein